jgi:hypothetical protein
MSQPIQSIAAARRVRFRTLAVLTLAGSLLAAPAWAAQITQIRVGSHPTFTRVVFELDAPAGYRVEEKGTASAPELVVTLDATSRPRSIRSDSAGVVKVDVLPGPNESVAHIALRAKGMRKHGVRLKEMILANPPRIVLDLMREDPVVAKTPAPEPKPKAAPEPKPEPKVAKTPAPEPKPKAAPEPKPAPEPKVAKTPEPKPPEPKVAKTPAPEPKPKASPEPKPAPEPKVAKTPAPEPKPPEPFKVEPAPPKPIVRVEPKPRPKQPEPAPAPRTAKTPRPAPEQGDSSSWLSNPIVVGGAAGLLLCAVGIGLVMRRRRPLPVDLDVDALGDSAPEPPMAGVQSQASLQDVPAASGGSGSTSSLSDLFDADPEPASGEATPATEAPAPAPVDKQIADLFSAEPAQEPTGDTSMNQAMSDLPADPDRAGPPVSSPAARGAAPDSDVLRVVHEIERRMQQLESKLQESNEARERLERQVAAQSEELRVQRAAIARTQRALRTMSRGNGEDKATEPALRDSDTQARTRVVE